MLIFDKMKNVLVFIWYHPCQSMLITGYDMIDCVYYRHSKHVIGCHENDKIFV